jgi:hypothetical protein
MIAEVLERVFTSMALWIMTDSLPLINADKIYFYRTCNITHETENHAAEAECAAAAAAAGAVYSHHVAATAQRVF